MLGIGTSSGPTLLQNASAKPAIPAETSMPTKTRKNTDLTEGVNGCFIVSAFLPLAHILEAARHTDLTELS